MKLLKIFCFLAGALSVGNCAFTVESNTSEALPDTIKNSTNSVGNSVAGNFTPTPKPTNEKTIPKQGVKTMKDSELLEDLADTFARASQKGFVTLEKVEEIPAQALADSKFWSSNFFTEKANPHQQTGSVKYGFHLATDDTIDLLRFEFQVGDLEITIIEAQQATMMQIKQTAPLSAQTIDRIAQQVLRMKYEKHEGEIMADEDLVWKFQYPSSIGEKSRFSTAPDKEPFGGASWRTVVDGGVQGGKLFFLCYKKNVQLGGFQGNPKRWFDDKFRSRWQRR